MRTRLVPVILPLRFRFGAAVPLRHSVPDRGQLSQEPAGAGTAGGTRGGDRLPWFETEPGQDNFTLLESLTWQVHVYGEPRSGLAEACDDLHLPLHCFAWQQGMRGAGFLRAALYLVRPDGYVALADPHADPERSRQYLKAEFAGQAVTTAEGLAEQRQAEPVAGVDRPRG